MIKLVKRHGILFITLFALLTSLFIYYKSLNFYFFQDDFYELLVSKADNFQEFLKLFKFQENRSSYRPIGLQFYYFASQTIFGLNPLYFRLVTFTLFIATYFLIATSVAKMLNNKAAGYITAIFWITSSIHFLSLSWIAASWLIIGSFFFFLTCLIFLHYINNHSKGLYVLSLLSFLLTLGSFEFFIAWPVIIGVWIMLFLKKDFQYTLKTIWPFIAVAIAYTFARLNFSSLPQITEYKMEISTNTLKHLFWYVLWSFNVPEEFKKQVTDNILSFNPVFLRDFGTIVLKSFIAMVAIISLGIFYPLVNVLKKNSQINVLLFCAVWFISSIIPVLVFPYHSFAMYLALPSIGVYMLIGYLLAKRKSYVLIAAVFIIWFYSSIVTVNFYRQIFWVEESQKFAKKFSVELMERYPTLGHNAVILYPLEDKRHRQAILNENAVKVLYDDPTIRIFFNEKNLDESIKNGQVKPENVLLFNN